MIVGGVIVGSMHTQAYKAAKHFLTTNERVKMTFGEPLEIRGKWFGNYERETETRNSSNKIIHAGGSAKFEFDISGSKGKGTAVVELYKTASWNIKKATLYINRSGKSIFQQEIRGTY
jgi:TIM21